MTKAHGRRVLSEHRAVIPLPSALLQRDLLRIPTGTVGGEEAPLVLGAVPGRTVDISGGPATFSATIGNAPLTIEINDEEGWVQAHGQWWWCGRFHAGDHPSGTLITQRTYNLAAGPTGWLVPITVGRGHAERGRQALQALITELGRRHNCEGHLVD